MNATPSTVRSRWACLPRRAGGSSELQAREDGLRGRVEWTPTGQQRMAEKAYSGISPAILHTQSGDVLQVLRASLTNTPNLLGLVALNSENTTMDWRMKLIELLGLDGETDDAAIEAALSAKMNAVQSEHSQNLLWPPDRDRAAVAAGRCDRAADGAAG